MTTQIYLRTCRDCHQRFPSLQATRSDGILSSTGSYCAPCGEIRARKRERIAREYEESLRQRSINISKNLWAAYGGWWKHFTPPSGWATLLRAESESCPYCGIQMSSEASSSLPTAAVIDHMDPLSLGGEDSLRNAVYCCRRCNGVKKNKRFTRWLAELSEPFRSRARAIYSFKHQHSPEDFQPGEYELRRSGMPMFLGLSEKDFKRELRGMLPLATEPPASYLIDLLQPHPGPVRIEELIFRFHRCGDDT